MSDPLSRLDARDPPPSDTERAAMTAIDAELTHVWMVRTFLKHCDEAEDDDDLKEVVRDLYDFVLALGTMHDEVDPAAYLKQAKKKLRRLRRAAELYESIQPEVSGHTNFVMAARSLRLAVNRIDAQVGLTNTIAPAADRAVDSSPE